MKSYRRTLIVFLLSLLFLGCQHAPDTPLKTNVAAPSHSALSTNWHIDYAMGQNKQQLYQQRSSLEMQSLEWMHSILLGAYILNQQISEYAGAEQAYLAEHAATINQALQNALESLDTQLMQPIAIDGLSPTIQRQWQIESMSLLLSMHYLYEIHSELPSKSHPNFSAFLDGFLQPALATPISLPFLMAFYSLH
ncbi:hypothetical protein VST7929_01517 [Vibrio stylophorae]|uniref:DUF3080 domain-containing protein n=2 Tax=Vibrio stylophorae TaxID=659351 RepID=A0ABM8ZTJ7_9VIBR|nr:hypothetical protein VST7929_01517 [Vibrio stylophorae]